MQEKLELEYPCYWLYKVIGVDEKAIRRAIVEIIPNRTHEIAHSNQSSKGKYISLNLGLTVKSEDDRTGIYESLKGHQAIKMVL